MTLEPLCPDLSAWRIVLIAPRRDKTVIQLDPLRQTVSCPVCGTPSSRVHSHYYRAPWDLPWTGWPVQLLISARRFFCDNPDCSRRIFTEPFSGILERYARQTERLHSALLQLAHLSSAEMASRVAKLLGFTTSGDSLIRRQRQEIFSLPEPRAVGVDEFALRRGANYGTLLVDLERHRPVEVLDGRSSETLVRWLRGRPGIKVIARDRDSTYAAAARTALPGAIQVADRFHLVQNVSEALKDLLRSRRWQRPKPGSENGLPDSDYMQPARKERPPTPRKLALWAAACERRRKGRSLSAIARELGIHRKTVRHYVSSDRPPVYSPRPARPGRLTPHLEYLRQRWREGCHNARELYWELLSRGYSGSEIRVKAAVAPWRKHAAPPAKLASSLASLVLYPSSRLDSDQQEELKLVLQSNPILSTGHRLKEWFQDLVGQRNVIGLERWLEEAAGSGIDQFRKVAASFRRDYGAVRLAFELPWSSGQCEGQICRVKMIKRQGYGRANVDLLRQRILHRVSAS